MKGLFIGNFSPPGSENKSAFSAAGNNVQPEIYRGLEKFLGNKINVLSMEPEEKWPSGKITVKSQSFSNQNFFGYLNIPILRDLIFSIKCFIYLKKTKINICVAYNPKFFLSLFLYLHSKVNRDFSSVAIIQDVLISSNSNKNFIFLIYERLAIKALSLNSLIIPVSKEIIDDFSLNIKKCLIFEGGLSEKSEELLSYKNFKNLQPYGLFAGMLEKYNGIDKLVSAWIEHKINYPLYIFGKGSLEEYIKTCETLNPNIIFKGFAPQKEIMEFQSRSMWNFCLRYSEEIHANYCFPSKLFEIVASPGCPVVNEFPNLPVLLRDYLYIVNEDLSDLNKIIDNSLTELNGKYKSNLEIRRKILISEFSWQSLMKRILKIIKNKG